MSFSALNDLTECRRFFAEPATPRQRQYEVLRAYFHDRLPSAEVAHRFGYTLGALRYFATPFDTATAGTLRRSAAGAARKAEEKPLVVLMATPIGPVALHVPSR